MGVDEAAHVLLDFVHGGTPVHGGVHQWVLVGILGRIGVHHGTEISNPIPRVFVPAALVVQRRLGEQLEELIAGGVRPLLLGQGQETCDEGRGVRCAVCGSFIACFIVADDDRATHCCRGGSLPPRGVVSYLAGGVDGADTDDAGPLGIAVVSLIFRVITHGGDDDDAEGIGSGDRPLG